MGHLPLLAELEIEVALVREGSAAAGASLSDLELRSRTGALVVGVRRGDRLREKPDPTIPFEPGDVVYIIGTGEGLRRALSLFDATRVSGAGIGSPDDEEQGEGRGRAAPRRGATWGARRAQGARSASEHAGGGHPLGRLLEYVLL